MNRTSTAECPSSPSQGLALLESLRDHVVAGLILSQIAVVEWRDERPELMRMQVLLEVLLKVVDEAVAREGVR